MPILNREYFLSSLISFGFGIAFWVWYILDKSNSLWVLGILGCLLGVMFFLSLFTVTIPKGRIVITEKSITSRNPSYMGAGKYKGRNPFARGVMFNVEPISFDVQDYGEIDAKTKDGKRVWLKVDFLYAYDPFMAEEVVKTD